MVVNLWYSTCPPCARELADFAAVEAEVGDDVRFVGVNPLRHGRHDGRASPPIAASPTSCSATPTSSRRRARRRRLSGHPVRRRRRADRRAHRPDRRRRAAGAHRRALAMLVVNLGLSFLRGMVAAVNPCGFVLLPTYLMFFLGLEATRDDSQRASVRRALLVSAVRDGRVHGRVRRRRGDQHVVHVVDRRARQVRHGRRRRRARRRSASPCSSATRLPLRHAGDRHRRARPDGALDVRVRDRLRHRVAQLHARAVHPDDVRGRRARRRRRRRRQRRRLRPRDGAARDGADGHAGRRQPRRAPRPAVVDAPRADDRRGVRPALRPVPRLLLLGRRRERGVRPASPTPSSASRTGSSSGSTTTGGWSPLVLGAVVRGRRRLRRRPTAAGGRARR